MKTDQQMVGAVMYRVQLIHARRALFSPRARFIALVVVAFVLSISVSIKNVFINAFHSATSLQGLFLFSVEAISSTEFFVQLFLFGGLVLAVFSIRDLCLYCLTSEFFAFITGRRHVHQEK